jgi:endoglucanase
MMGVENENAYDEDGTQSIGYLDVGDWATYDVSVPQAGTYNVAYRVASLTGDGTIQLEKSGGGIVYGTVDVQSTGDWYNWTTVSHEVDLPQGELSLALVTNESGYNLNWFEVTPVSTNPVGDYSVSVQAENYTAMSGVENGGDTVGYLDAGDWMTYASVDIPRSGTYTIEYHVASALSSGVIQFEQAGGAVQYNSINVPDTGGWNDFTTIKHQVNLPAGSQSFALYVISGGWNIDWFTIREGVH